MSTDPDHSAQPETLLELAQSDPKEALGQGRMLMGQLPTHEHAGRSEVLRALGIAARLGADMSDSLSYGEEAVAEANAAADWPLRSAALVSLAGSLAISGDNFGALGLLDEAHRAADEVLQADIDFQRGAVFSRIGETTKALASYSRALPLFVRAGDRVSQSMTLHNRGMLYLHAGKVTVAERDLTAAREIDATDGRKHWVAGEDHGLGVAAWLRGDIPQALRLFDRSESQLSDLLGSASEIQVSRCEVLLSAGLFREARALARQIADDMHGSGLAQDEAEARLVAAHAALLAGDVETARSWAVRAEDMFTDQQRPTWAAVARLIGIQAQSQAGAADAAQIEEAHRAAETLDESRHSLAAFRAWLLAGTIALRLGLEEQARLDLSRVAAQTPGPIEMRLQSWLAMALLRTIDGDNRGADAAARAGLDLLTRYQAALGATDIRVGVERHARELATLGLRMAVGSHRPRRVFRWMERARGGALAHRPAAPPADDELVAELAELRQVTGQLRDAQENRATDLMRRQRRLQESIRSRARRSRGGGSAADRPKPGPLRDALSDRTLVELASLDGRLWAVVVRNGRFRLQEVGDEGDVLTELASLRFMMRRLARGRGAVATAAEVARRLDRLLFGPLRLGPGPLVIVPTPDLHAVPWFALPACRDRAVVVSPSAELWYRASRRGPSHGRALLAAGPDLALSDAEILELAKLYPEAAVMSSDESTADMVQSHLDGARIAHIASHALFRYENPMFSSLRLADGDLYVYDIERLETAPGVVVLSACDSGFTETHPGEELMGLSSALLSMGTRSIIASVGLVPDSAATRDLMVALHRGLLSGLSPSAALHHAQTESAATPEGHIAASSFICIGAG